MANQRSEKPDLPNLPEGVEAEVDEIIRTGSTLAAIAKLCQLTGWSAGDSKRWVADRKMSLEWEPWPCPYCGDQLRTGNAKQCLSCGMDWHDPANVRRLP
jgi:hypothetical protein